MATSIGELLLQLQPKPKRNSLFHRRGYNPRKIISKKEYYTRYICPHCLKPHPILITLKHSLGGLITLESNGTKVKIAFNQGKMRIDANHRNNLTTTRQRDKELIMGLLVLEAMRVGALKGFTQKIGEDTYTVDVSTPNGLWCLVFPYLLFYETKETINPYRYPPRLLLRLARMLRD